VQIVRLAVVRNKHTLATCRCPMWLRCDPARHVVCVSPMCFSHRLCAQSVQCASCFLETRPMCRNNCYCQREPIRYKSVAVTTTLMFRPSRNVFNRITLTSPLASTANSGQMPYIPPQNLCNARTDNTASRTLWKTYIILCYPQARRLGTLSRMNRLSVDSQI
jgi:hypothetical protein